MYAMNKGTRDERSHTLRTLPKSMEGCLGVLEGTRVSGNAGPAVYCMLASLQLNLFRAYLQSRAKQGNRTSM